MKHKYGGFSRVSRNQASCRESIGIEQSELSSKITDERLS